MRKPIIAGNWKMNKNQAEARELINELLPLVKDAEAEVAICVPFTNLELAVELTKGTNVKVGAQNVHFAKSGAYTGEISADMLKELGVEYVIIGHSERRQYFGETDETVNLRSKAAIANGLKPIICVGELKEERVSGKTEEVVKTQTIGALKDFDEEMMKSVVIAYEPVWAIGTGLTATNEQANETIGYIRKVVAEILGQKVADEVRIQYGGSMNPTNAKELMAMPEIDGGLIGGASLKAENFSKVVKYNG
ncbi:MAG: triose-phosphate isomerase [Clostridia bacterium]|nr:triose-phosphate isomerase [Clostridia bacterium]MBR6692932.1 triose-phosphate isomerase [Clostridia bacterium]